MPLPKSFQGTLKLPVVAAPMFLVSGPRLLIENCKAGIVGTFPALNQRSSEGFEEWLVQIKTELAEFEASTGQKAAPFGVNLIVHKTNPRLQADLEICIKHKVPLIITSLGAVTELVDAVHSYGGAVFHDVTNRRHGEKAAEAGVDGLIAVSAGAGGHAGTTNPFALMQELRDFFDGTILLAGCLNSGQDVAAALQMGADLAYIGTRFINTEESQADQAYKQMIIDCASKDIVHTPAVSGVPASFMRPSMEQAGYDMDKATSPGEVDYGTKLQPVSDEAKAWKTVWSAGQGCAGIKNVVPTSALVEQMKSEFREAIEQQNGLLKTYS
ncbi:MAG: nitronate monooxygenase family protein [Pseudomonadales bacterium]|nr:nitronate monooxygenase family protein [Pseudomonadales bacterium]